MTGELTYHVINSVILTAMVAIFVLWRYRVTVLNGMMRGDDDVLPLPAVQLHADTRSGMAAAAASLVWEKRLQRHIALAYLLTTLICALPLAFACLYLGGVSFSPAQGIMLALVYTFTCAPMIAVSQALPPMRMLAGLALLTAFLTALAVGGLLVERSVLGRHIGWQQLTLAPVFLTLAASQLWLPALFILMTWPLKVRGVVPITFAALLIFGLAPFIGARLIGAMASTVAGTPSNLKLGMNGMFVLMALPAGWLAWRRLYQMARGYEGKRFSDAQLLSRTWWLILVANVGLQTGTSTHEPWLLLGACTVVALAFAPVNGMLLSRIRPTDGQPPARNLLLLRVFGYTSRTERLFDRIGARWRLLGPVTMIAAPDVVARTIDPSDYLRWLTGRADELFVTSRADLDAKLVTLDTVPDPDGRYRVNEFCCRDNTWQATVVELMRRADAVVMDVRGVTRERRGCEFELQQLAQRLPPQRLVLVADATTELAVLAAAFGPKVTSVRVIEVRGSRNTNAVFEALLEAAA